MLEIDLLRRFYRPIWIVVGTRIAKPGTQIDVESFGPFGQQMLNLVETIRRQHNVLN
jgi:hypothetical protein